MGVYICRSRLKKISVIATNLANIKHLFSALQEDPDADCAIVVSSMQSSMGERQFSRQS